MHEGSKRAIVAAFLANLGIAVSKLVAFAVTGAASMLAEAIHSFADTGNQGLLMLGGRRARRAPNDEHQFGFGPERYFWAFVVALVLFSLGSLFALYEGIDKLRNPHELDSPTVALVVLGVAFALESLSLRTAVHEASPQRGPNRSWWRFIRHTKSPELPVVLLEDVGALLGLLFAIAGVLLATVTDNARFDAMGSVAIGALLGVIAVVLAVEMKSLLIGESASSADDEQIRAAIADGHEVLKIIHLRTMHLGPEEILVGAKLEFSSTTIPELAAEIDAVEARIRRAVPAVGMIYLEPDLYRAP